MWTNTIKISQIQQKLKSSLKRRIVDSASKPIGYLVRWQQSVSHHALGLAVMESSCGAWALRSQHMVSAWCKLNDLEPAYFSTLCYNGIQKSGVVCCPKTLKSVSIFLSIWFPRPSLSFLNKFSWDWFIKLNMPGSTFNHMFNPTQRHFQPYLKW